MTKLQELREILGELTYAEMMTIASWLANTEKSEDDANEASFWAYVLNDMARNLDLAEDYGPEDDQEAKANG